MPSRTLIAVVSCFLASSDAVAQRATAAQPYDLAEAYQVYSALLPREESVGFAKGTLVIQQETVSRTEPPEPCVTPDAAVRFKDAIADYKRVNSKPRLLQRQFQIDEPYEIVNSDTIDLLFKQGDWDGFYTRYPGSGGYVTLSGVGFNQDQTRAIVYSGSVCGNLCGRWSLHLLEKIAGKWREVAGVGCFTVS